MKAGEWLGLAERVEELQKDLGGTALAPQWPMSLEFLRKDCLELAGAECVHEVRGWEHDLEADRAERRAA